jgi:predicted nucleotidyltransferase
MGNPTKEVLAEANRVVLAMFSGFDNAFLTGSRAFGWSTKDSDFDICVHMADKERAFALLDQHAEPANSERSLYYDSAKGHRIRIAPLGFRMDITINVSPLHPLDMLCWWLATREIQHIAKLDSQFLSAKEHKHGAFELLRGFYKQSIRYMGVVETSEMLSKDQQAARIQAAKEAKLP